MNFRISKTTTPFSFFQPSVDTKAATDHARIKAITRSINYYDYFVPANEYKKAPLTRSPHSLKALTASNQAIHQNFTGWNGKGSAKRIANISVFGSLSSATTGVVGTILGTTVLEPAALMVGGAAMFGISIALVCGGIGAIIGNQLVSEDVADLLHARVYW